MPPPRLAGTESVAGALMDVLNARLLARIKAASSRGDGEEGETLEEVLAELVGAAAVHWEGQGWTHPREVEMQVQAARRQAPRQGEDGLGGEGGDSAGGGGGSPAAAGRELWEKQAFWRRWGDWEKIKWCREAEQMVRNGVITDVISKTAGREAYDLQAGLETVLTLLVQWRGRSPTSAEMEGPVQPLLKRFYLRWLAERAAPAARSAVVSAASAAMDTNGMTEEQRIARAAAEKASMLSSSGGASYAHAEELTALPGGAGGARLGGRGAGRGRGGRGGRRGGSWNPPAFAGTCWVCGKQNHRAGDCPNKVGGAAPPTGIAAQTGMVVP